MVVASLELIRAREVAGRLLDHLGFEAYLFEVEPCPSEWTLRVECAAPDGWRVGTVSLPKDDLLAGIGDPAAFGRLVEICRVRFSGCALRRPPA